MKFLKLLAISYAIKTVLFGLAWWMIPDLPQRAMAAFHHTVAWLEWTAEADAAPAASPSIPKR
jgi:hypothetical protein